MRKSTKKTLMKEEIQRKIKRVGTWLFGSVVTIMALAAMVWFLEMNEGRYTIIPVKLSIAIVGILLFQYVCVVVVPVEKYVQSPYTRLVKIIGYALIIASAIAD